MGIEMAPCHTQLASCRSGRICLELAAFDKMVLEATAAATTDYTLLGEISEAAAAATRDFPLSISDKAPPYLVSLYFSALPFHSYSN